MNINWSKYKAKPTVIDGIRFDSQKEGKRYCALKLLLMSGDIKDLALQPTFSLDVNGIRICQYRADFSYKEKGVTITEDVKGFKTPVYRLKKKLMKAIHGIDIREV